MHIDPIQPEGWARPSGYSNGMLVNGAGSLLFVAGQVAWDADQQLVGAGDFGVQFHQALSNVLEVVRAAGGRSEHLVRMTIYVTDKSLYTGALKEVGAAWRELIGRHYPAMALVQVADLLEPGAMVEIEATAAIATGAAAQPPSSFVD